LLLQQGHQLGPELDLFNGKDFASLVGEVDVPGQYAKGKEREAHLPINFDIQADDARQSLEKEFAPRDKALVASQKAVRELEEKLTRDGAIMSETERRKLERDVISQKRDLKRSQEEFREDLNIRRNEAFDKLRRRVFEVITDISKKENYDLVVSDGVVYANDRIDITGKIIDRLKQEFKQSSKK